LRLLLLSAPLALAACGEAPEPEPTPTATPTVAAPRTLVAADFDPATLGASDAIQVSSDSGQIIWRVTEGSGWKPGMPVTFWWQSTTPPDGPADAYSLEVNGMTASAKGPFPPAAE
jgi:hypothetical protein